MRRLLLSYLLGFSAEYCYAFFLARRGIGRGWWAYENYSRELSGVHTLGVDGVTLKRRALIVARCFRMDGGDSYLCRRRGTFRSRRGAHDIRRDPVLREPRIARCGGKTTRIKYSNYYQSIHQRRDAFYARKFVPQIFGSLHDGPLARKTPPSDLHTHTLATLQSDAAVLCAFFPQRLGCSHTPIQSGLSILYRVARSSTPIQTAARRPRII
jgi:hypothetical protein